MAAGLARAQRGQPEGDVPISLEATGLSEGSEGAGTAHLLGRAGTHATRGCACARPGQPGWAPEEGWWELLIHHWLLLRLTNSAVSGTQQARGLLSLLLFYS